MNYASSNVAKMNTKTLYEQDYDAWLTHTASLLRSGRISELDIDSLAEEIEGMSRSERQALRSNLVILLIHLLKYTYQPQKHSTSWISSINEHRRRIEFALEDSPSLKPYLEKVFSDCYKKARRDAAQETDLPLYAFPETSLFTIEQSLDHNWLPSADRQ